MTTAPAPTTVLSPIVTPGQTITPPPSQTLSPIVIGFAYSQPMRARLGIDRVGRGQELDARGELAGGADPDRRDVEHDAVEVDERARADRDVAAVVAAEAAA